MKTVCEIHREIENNLKDILNWTQNAQKYNETDDQIINDLIYDIEFEVNSILDKINDAQSLSESMEKRLFEYRDAIESLGFVRNK